MESSFGLEILFQGVKSNLRDKHDAVFCAVHCALVRAKFKCVGKGEQWPSGGVEPEGSELLPDGWNSEANVYTLLYTGPAKKSYVLKAVLVNGVLLVNFLRLSDNQVADLSIKVNQFCTGNIRQFKSCYKNLPDLESQLTRDIIGVFLPKTSSSEATTTSRRTDHSTTPRADPLADPLMDPLRVGPVYQGGVAARQPGGFDPFSVGRADLDPLAGPMAGGMMVDPNAMMGGGRGGGFGGPGIPGRLPPGSVPPGARFDPMNPPDIDGMGGPRAGPDPDHMRPPGFDDDFYM